MAAPKAIGLLAPALALALVPCAVASPRNQGIFGAIESEYGIRICHRIDRNFFPPEWRVRPVRARALPLGKKELARFPMILSAALSRYPKGFIPQHLTRIGLAREMYYYGISYGATSVDDIIYLNDRGKKKGYSDDYIAGNLHHELAHILYAKSVFPDAEWVSCNPPGFVYRGGEDGGREAIRTGRDSLRGSEELLARGFLNEYSLSCLEEDFCTYSEHVLARPESFMRAMQAHPAIRKKFLVWLSFYRSFDERFTEEYLFRDRAVRR